MDFGFLFAGERAGTFHDQVNAQFAPWQFGRIAGGEVRDFFAVDDEVFFIMGNIGVKAAVNSVKFGQVGVGLDAAAGVDGNDVELVLQFVVENSAHYLAADAAVTVDGNFDTHGFSSSFGFGLWIEWRQL